MLLLTLNNIAPGISAGGAAPGPESTPSPDPRAGPKPLSGTSSAVPFHDFMDRSLAPDAPAAHGATAGAVTAAGNDPHPNGKRLPDAVEMGTGSTDLEAQPGSISTAAALQSDPRLLSGAVVTPVAAAHPAPDRALTPVGSSDARQGERGTPAHLEAVFYPPRQLDVGASSTRGVTVAVTPTPLAPDAASAPGHGVAAEPGHTPPVGSGSAPTQATSEMDSELALPAAAARPRGQTPEPVIAPHDPARPRAEAGGALETPSARAVALEHNQGRSAASFSHGVTNSTAESLQQGDSAVRVGVSVPPSSAPGVDALRVGMTGVQRAMPHAGQPRSASGPHMAVSAHAVDASQAVEPSTASDANRFTMSASRAASELAAATTAARFAVPGGAPDTSAMARGIDPAAAAAARVIAVERRPAHVPAPDIDLTVAVTSAPPRVPPTDTLRAAPIVQSVPAAVRGVDHQHVPAAEVTAHRAIQLDRVMSSRDAVAAAVAEPQRHLTGPLTTPLAVDVPDASAESLLPPLASGASQISGGSLDLGTGRPGLSPGASNQPAFAADLGNRVVWMVHQNVQSAGIRLNPPHLGPLEIHVSVVDGETSVVFTSPHAVVREVLESAMPRLRDTLGDLGLTLADTHIADHSSFRQHDRSRSSPSSTVATPSLGAEEPIAASTAMRPDSDALLDLYA